MDQFLKAIHYIEDHLSDDLTVRLVAQAACYSDFHFSRMFTTLVGEPLMVYVRKRRLTVAAQRLLTEDVKLIDVALDSNFESQQTFNRAFKKMFSCTPGEYRRRRDPVAFSFRNPFTRKTLVHLKEKLSMEPRIVEDAGFMAIGMMKELSRDTSDEIPALWQCFGSRIQSVPNKFGYRSFGICEPIDEISGEGNFSYTAAVEVSSLSELPKGLVAKQVPGQTYAVFTHKMHASEISRDMKTTVQYIWGTWLPQSNFVNVEAPDFEVYDERFDPTKMEGEIDIYIPVVARG